MDIPLKMTNRVAIPVQHHQPPINRAEHHTTHRHNTPTPRTNLNLNPTIHHKFLMEGHPKIRSKVTERLRTPNNHPMEASNIKTLMGAINLNNSLPLLTSSHLTAHLQTLNNRLMEVFNAKIPMEVTKVHRHCNTHLLQVIRVVLDMVPLLLVTFHSRNTITSKVCTMQNILVDYMATVLGLVVLPYPQAPIHTTARMHLLHLNTVRLLTNMVDSKDGNVTSILGSKGEKVSGIFRERICILIRPIPAIALKHLCTAVIRAYKWTHLAEWNNEH